MFHINHIKSCEVRSYKVRKPKDRGGLGRSRGGLWTVFGRSGVGVGWGCLGDALEVFRICLGDVLGGFLGFLRMKHQISINFNFRVPALKLELGSAQLYQILAPGGVVPQTENNATRKTTRHGIRPPH